jgi:hypothetical protein
MKTLKELRQKGYNVRINHVREYEANGRVSGKGGYTLVTLQDAGTGEVATGAAECSRKDSYSRKLGVEKALHRAKIALMLTQKLRKSAENRAKKLADHLVAVARTPEEAYGFYDRNEHNGRSPGYGF